MSDTITLGATQPPKVCRRCGASPCLHGGNNRPYHRHGWYRYRCGSRWHEGQGFTFDAGCTLSVLRKHLVKVTRMRDMAKVRRLTHDILKTTASDFEQMPVRRFRMPLYDEERLGNV